MKQQCANNDERPVKAKGLCSTCYVREYQRTRRGSTARHLPPGDSGVVQTRMPVSVILAVASRAAAEGLSRREAWERAGREWADRG